MMKNIIILVMAKLGFDKLPMSKKAGKALSIVEKMDGNPDFPSPVPTLAEVTTAALELQSAVEVLDGSRLKTTIKNAKEKALDTKMSGLRGYVQAASAGDEVKIKGAGFEVRQTNKRVGVSGAATGITLRPVVISGKVTLRWKPVKKTRLYLVEYSIGNDQNWQWAGEISKAKMVFENLPSGSIVYFRIACINAAGRSPWSNTVCCKVY